MLRKLKYPCPKVIVRVIVIYVIVEPLPDVPTLLSYVARN